MTHKHFARSACLAALCAAALAAPPLAASVRDGVEAWSRGDYAAAVAEWQAPAAAGDADAMFNLAQAYRLGRGVPPDLDRAEALYAQAAQAGHLQAADTYGLMLFQDGRREQALSYVEAAARRGDPRAQYLLGIAHFNGDLVERDWERAYALLLLANSAGLPQASEAVAQMDEHISLDQRQQAAALAQRMQQDADGARAVELTSADLGASAGPAGAGQAGIAISPPPSALPPPSRPAPDTAVSPSVAAARAAVAEARQATGTSSPAEAGASFARAAVPSPPSAPPPTPAATARATPPPAPAATPARARAEAAPPAPARAAGPWRVQLGAFSVRGNAERLWNRVASRPEIAGRERLLIASGGLTKLQAGGFATRTEAQAACGRLRNSGHDCLVTRG